MTLAQVKKRLDELERAVNDLKNKVDAGDPLKKPWWEAEVGRFKDDPMFEEAVAMGRKWRESFRPKRRKVKRDRT